MTKSLQFYSSTTKHKQAATIVSLLLPVVFACTQDKGIEWLRESWSTVISYIQVFEKGYLHLHVSLWCHSAHQYSYPDGFPGVSFRKYLGRSLALVVERWSPNLVPRFGFSRLFWISFRHVLSCHVIPTYMYLSPYAASVYIWVENSGGLMFKTSTIIALGNW